LILRLTNRISGDAAEIPPTTSRKPQKSAIFSRAFDQRPTAEKILPRFDISSDSFVLAAEKRRIPLANFYRMSGICFAACKSIVPADTWIPGQRFGRRAMESPKRPVERNS
jgi:hypothetical protein